MANDKLRVRVRPGDGATVGEVLAKLGDPAAAEEGRAFVNGHRARPLDPAAPGDELATWAARAVGGAGGGEGTDPVQVLFERGGLLVAYKPAALPTTPDRRGDRSLTGELEKLLGARAVDTVHAASRLDVGVSGVVLCAMGAQANQHVAAMRAGGFLHRVYVGLAGALLGREGGDENEGQWNAPIGRTQGPSGRSRPTAGGKDEELALTRYRAVAWARAAQSSKSGGTTLLRLEPATGRMHQLRAHAAAAGAPLLGDLEHGGARTLVRPNGSVRTIPRIALHALFVELPGERGEALHVESAVPEDLRSVWEALGGDPSAWERTATPR